MAAIPPTVASTPEHDRGGGDTLTVEPGAIDNDPMGVILPVAVASTEPAPISAVAPSSSARSSWWPP